MLMAFFTCMIGVAGGCSVTSKTSAYPAQYKAFRDKANAACDDLFDALDARDRRGTLAAIRRLLSAKAPPDLRLRWAIFKGDVRRYFLASNVVSDRAAKALDDGADELGLEKC